MADKTGQKDFDESFPTKFIDISGGAGTAFARPVAIVDATGEVAVTGTRSSYSAAVTGLAPAATATDIFTLTGSATKTVRIRRVRISGFATGTNSLAGLLLLRSTANSGGTATQPTAVKSDSTNAAGTAVCDAYTANPTLGVLVGIIRADRWVLAAAAGTVSGQMIYDFGGNGQQAITLRGTGEVFALNLNGVTAAAGAAFNIAIEWTEE